MKRFTARYSLQACLYSLALVLCLTVGRATAAAGTEAGNLVTNPGLEQVSPTGVPEGYLLEGDVRPRAGGDERTEVTTRYVALDAGVDRDGDGARMGSLAQRITGIGPALGRWYRFAFRGLPQDGFTVADDQLFMKVEFYAGGSRYLDCVTRKIYPVVERSRRDLAWNGVGKRGGAAVWRDYQLDFKLPFPEVDQLQLIIGFRNGTAAGGTDTAFLVDDLSLTRIADPTPAPATERAPVPLSEGATLVPLGGRWFYARPEGQTEVPLVFDRTNAERLLYRAGRLEAPFAGNTTAVLKAGFLDRAGKLAEEDQFVPDNVTVAFEAGMMVVRTRNLPNHPVGRFPDRARAIDGNPNYIREFDFTFFIPLEPERQPRALAMDAVNRNHALPTACGTAIAANGVLFHNPYDAGMTEAVDIMDRCCGHPSPDSRYHYHKYPVCVKSPWADEGEEHSPLIGWAFDGFPIYGPYEGKGVMARDDEGNPLNAFNVHRDTDRGWHYHVTPGKFPYVMGGYWGKVEPRNFLNEPGVRDMGRGPGLLPDPLLAAINEDRDMTLSADELARAPQRLQALDRNGDGALSLAEIRPPLPGLLKGLLGPPPGGPAPGGPGRGPGPGARPTPPLYFFLDRDNDGTLSAQELAGAAQALLETDRDGDGALSRPELQLTRFRRQ